MKPLKAMQDFEADDGDVTGSSGLTHVNGRITG
jgi:hypothetical protein